MAVCVCVSGDASARRTALPGRQTGVCMHARCKGANRLELELRWDSGVNGLEEYWSLRGVLGCRTDCAVEISTCLEARLELPLSNVWEWVESCTGLFSFSSARRGGGDVAGEKNSPPTR